MEPKHNATIEVGPGFEDLFFFYGVVGELRAIFHGCLRLDTRLITRRYCLSQKKLMFLPNLCTCEPYIF